MGTRSMTTSDAGRPLDADAALVRTLVDEQGDEGVREVARRGVALVTRGWDNSVFRLGGAHGDLVARLPRRRSAATLLTKEERWLGEITAPLRVTGVRVPRGVLAGRPGAGYPWPWAVLTWLDGAPVSELAVERRDALAEPLADALARLHRPAPPDAPANPFRGVPLAARAPGLQSVWPAVAHRVGTAAAGVLRSGWEAGLRAPQWDRAPVWVHGDPHPFNLVHRDGGDLGLVDFGDLAAGDPACDVATAWLTFGAAARARFLEVLVERGSYDDAIERRAAGWAALVAAAVVVDDRADDRFRALARHVVTQLGG